MHTPASSPHNTPTPNQGAPSRHCSDVGNTLATVFPSTRETRWVEKMSETGLKTAGAPLLLLQAFTLGPMLIFSSPAPI